MKTILPSLFLMLGLLVCGRAQAQEVTKEDQPLFDALRLDVGTTVGFYDEELSWRSGDLERAQARSLWQARLDVGLGYTLGHALSAQVVAASSLGLGFVLVEGDLPLHLAQRLGLSWSFGPGFRAGLAADVGLQLNMSTPSQSFLGLGGQASIGWRWLELAYAPALIIGLDQEQTPVFGGERLRGLSTGSIAHTLAIRTSWDL